MKEVPIFNGVIFDLADKILITIATANTKESLVQLLKKGGRQHFTMPLNGTDH